MRLGEFGVGDDLIGDSIESTGEAKGEIKCGGDDGVTVSGILTSGTVSLDWSGTSTIIGIFFSGDTATGTAADPGDAGEMIPKANSDSVIERSPADITSCSCKVSVGTWIGAV